MTATVVLFSREKERLVRPFLDEKLSDEVRLRDLVEVLADLEAMDNALFRRSLQGAETLLGMTDAHIAEYFGVASYIVAGWKEGKMTPTSAEKARVCEGVGRRAHATLKVLENDRAAVSR